MIKYLTILLLLCAANVHAQQKKVKKEISLIDQASMRLDPNHFRYDPVKGFEIYLQAALQGNPKAMNAVGVLYSEGVGIPQNKETGFEWFKKSADHDYAGSWVNLGRCYSRGQGTVQDFEKAFISFSKGSLAKSSEASQGKGYLLYKGFGCEQNYEEAVQLFKQGVKGGVLASMYFLGLCYRNGYGTTVNIDSARYWLAKADRLGYPVAKDELANPRAEYVPTEASKRSAVSMVSFVKQNRSDKEFIPVEQPEASMIAGKYKGYAIRYDWSGQYVISKTPLNLILRRNGNLFNGSWKEGDNTSAEVQAALNGQGMLFHSTVYKRENQYSQKRAISYEFKNADLKVLKQGDSVYLAGNIKLWDLENNEPERPLYISLSRSQEEVSELAPSKGLQAYPNPFNHTLQVTFTLEKASLVKILLADMSGQVVYNGSAHLDAGRQEQSIKPDVPPGAYILKVTYEDKVKTVVVIKY
ncbi:hypothetical protein QFZ20_002131 [Flavobacterium sp. W4I14]|nr:hypothetical protein [Flavobacterium sp. W4I14]